MNTHARILPPYFGAGGPLGVHGGAGVSRISAYEKKRYQVRANALLFRSHLAEFGGDVVRISFAIGDRPHGRRRAPAASPRASDRSAVRGVRCGQRLAPRRRAPGKKLSAARSQHRPTTRNRGEQRRGAPSRARPAAGGPHGCCAPSEQRGGPAGRRCGKVDWRAGPPIWAL